MSLTLVFPKDCIFKECDYLNCGCMPKEKEINMNIKQVDYRKIDKLNATGIKMFDKDRFAFYRQYVLKEKKKDNLSSYVVLGNLVDFALSDCLGNWEEFERRFDEKFKLLSVKKGSGQFFDLADALYELTLRDMDEEGNLISSFSDRFKEAFDSLQAKDKFKGKTMDFALEKFKDSDAETYFSENLSSMDKMVVDQWMLDKAKLIVENTITDENVNYLFENQKDVENLGKYVIEWEIEGIEAKCELDNIKVNHDAQSIEITEIKSTYDAEEFSRTYLKMRYDLAAVFYIKAVQWLIENSKLPKYSVEFKFLVVDTSNQQLRPLIYNFSITDYKNSLNGFTTKSGYTYKGLNELISEIKWCQSTQEWRMSKEAYENNGVLNLNINYE